MSNLRDNLPLGIFSDYDYAISQIQLEKDQSQRYYKHLIEICSKDTVSTKEFQEKLKNTIEFDNYGSCLCKARKEIFYLNRHLNNKYWPAYQKDFDKETVAKSIKLHLYNGLTYKNKFWYLLGY